VAAAATVGRAMRLVLVGLEFLVGRERHAATTGSSRRGLGLESDGIHLNSLWASHGDREFLQLGKELVQPLDRPVPDHHRDSVHDLTGRRLQAIHEQAASIGMPKGSKPTSGSLMCVMAAPTMMTTPRAAP
jgi:hypothetical protein